MKNYLLNLFGLLLLLQSCVDENDLTRDFPRVKTLPVTNITPDGVTFSGTITDNGATPIIEVGFVWAKTVNPGLYNDLKTGTLLSDKFSVEVTTRLRKNDTYYVRAYAKNEAGYVFLGQDVSFVSLGANGPELKLYTPQAGTFMDYITIEGVNFSKQLINNKVYFDDIQSQVAFGSDSFLLARVPKELVNEQYTINVSVSGNISTFNQTFRLQLPVLKPILNSTILEGDTLNLIFDKLNLGNDINVDFNGVEAEVVNYKKDTLGVKVPEGIQEPPLKLNVKVNNYIISRALE